MTTMMSVAEIMNELTCIYGNSLSRDKVVTCFTNYDN